MNADLIIYCICIILAGWVFWGLGYNAGKNSQPIIATAEKQECVHSAVSALTPEIFSGYKDGDYIVCYPDMGNGHRMTLNEEIIKTITEKLMVDAECLINADGVDEEDRILGRIEAETNIIRFLKRNLGNEPV
jgi:hypothetical protein